MGTSSRTNAHTAMIMRISIDKIARIPAPSTFGEPSGSVDCMNHQTHENISYYLSNCANWVDRFVMPSLAIIVIMNKGIHRQTAVLSVRSRSAGLEKHRGFKKMF